MSNRSRISLTLQDKLKLIKDSKRKNKSQLCSKYGCSLSTVQRILKERNAIVEKSKTANITRKRLRSGRYGNVERALSLWCSQRRENGERVTRKMLREEAKKLAGDMAEDFTPSSGWLSRWQLREGIAMQKAGGDEDSSGDSDSEGEKHAITEYEPADIFNAKETALFYRRIPRSFLVSAHEPPPRNDEFPFCRERLTVLLICNGTGTYKKAIVIGKPPGCNSEALPLQYVNQSKAAMTQLLWMKILTSFDKEMAEAGRRIKLYVDNTPVHREYDPLKNINLQFLPSNEPAPVQPLTQGIIEAFKEHYRDSVTQKQLAVIDRGRSLKDFIKEFGIPEAVHGIDMAWQSVQPDLIVSCFQKANLIPGCESVAVESMDNDVVKHLLNEISVEDCEKDVPCHGDISDEEMIIEVSPVLVLDSSDDTEEDERGIKEGAPKKVEQGKEEERGSKEEKVKKEEKGAKTSNGLVKAPSKEDALKAFNSLRENLDIIERFIMETPKKRVVQKLITDSFRPNR